MRSRNALVRLRDDKALRARLGAAGRERFRQEFAIPAYAWKIGTTETSERSVALGVRACQRLRPRVPGA